MIRLFSEGPGTCHVTQTRLALSLHLLVPILPAPNLPHLWCLLSPPKLSFWSISEFIFFYFCFKKENHWKAFFNQKNPILALQKQKISQKLINNSIFSSIFCFKILGRRPSQTNLWERNMWKIHFLPNWARGGGHVCFLLCYILSYSEKDGLNKIMIKSIRKF